MQTISFQDTYPWGALFCGTSFYSRSTVSWYHPDSFLSDLELNSTRFTFLWGSCSSQTSHWCSLPAGRFMSTLEQSLSRLSFVRSTVTSGFTGTQILLAHFKGWLKEVVEVVSREVCFGGIRRRDGIAQVGKLLFKPNFFRWERIVWINFVT